MVNLLLWLLPSTLAVFRLSEMVVIDDGPFEIFFNLRGWANRPPLDEHPARRNLAGVLSCVHCTGVWFSFFFAIVFYFSTHSSIVESILLFLSTAGLQSIVSNNFGRGAK